MPFLYRVLTANCANDYLGDQANQHVIELLCKDNLDFLLINCQEANFLKVEVTLAKLVEEHGYVIKCLATMATHTQMITQFHAGTGIASIVIYKNTFEVEVLSSITVRRNTCRFSQSAYNKGGLITNFSLRGKDAGEQIFIRAISAHIESYKPQIRTRDWLNLHLAEAKNSMECWQELCDFFPHLMLTGYDLNTRNQITTDGEEVRVWDNAWRDPHIQAICLVPFVNAHFAKEITYNKSISGELAEDPKRAGFAMRGMLDFVGIADGLPHDEHLITDNRVIAIALEPSSRRDHLIIISPLHISIGISDFDRVKGQIALRLDYVAPMLARNIRHLTESEKSKQQLIEYYNYYLSKQGFVNCAMAIHIKKQEVFHQLVSASLIKRYEVEDMLFQVLFHSQAWCDDSSMLLLTHKRNLTKYFLDSIRRCQCEYVIQSRLNWYLEILQQMTGEEGTAPLAEFKRKAIAEYLNRREKLVSGLNQIDSGEDAQYVQFKETGMRLLEQLDQAAIPDYVFLIKQDNSLEHLDRLIYTARYCQEACEAIYDKMSDEKEIEHMIQRMHTLSQEMEAKPAPLWKRIGQMLLDFLVAFLGLMHLSNPFCKNYSSQVDTCDVTFQSN